MRYEIECGPNRPTNPVTCQSSYYAIESDGARRLVTDSNELTVASISVSLEGLQKYVAGYEAMPANQQRACGTRLVENARSQAARGQMLLEKAASGEKIRETQAEQIRFFYYPIYW